MHTTKEKLYTLRSGAMVYLSAASVATVYADGQFSDLISSISKMYTDIRPVIFVLAAIALIICAAMWFLSKDAKRADEAFQWGKRIVIGVVVVAIAPWIIVTVVGLFNGMSNKGLEDVENMLGS